MPTNTKVKSELKTASPLQQFYNPVIDYIKDKDAVRRHALSYTKTPDDAIRVQKDDHFLKETFEALEIVHSNITEDAQIRYAKTAFSYMLMMVLMNELREYEKKKIMPKAFTGEHFNFGLVTKELILGILTGYASEPGISIDHLNSSHLKEYSNSSPPIVLGSYTLMGALQSRTSKLLNVGMEEYFFVHRRRIGQIRVTSAEYYKQFSSTIVKHAAVASAFVNNLIAQTNCLKNYPAQNTDIIGVSNLDPDIILTGLMFEDSQKLWRLRLHSDEFWLAWSNYMITALAYSSFLEVLKVFDNPLSLNQSYNALCDSLNIALTGDAETIIFEDHLSTAYTAKTKISKLLNKFMGHVLGAPPT